MVEHKTDKGQHSFEFLDLNFEFLNLILDFGFQIPGIFNTDPRIEKGSRYLKHYCCSRIKK